jgi:hypothetical protein
MGLPTPILTQVDPEFQSLPPLETYAFCMAYDLFENIPVALRKSWIGALARSLKPGGRAELMFALAEGQSYREFLRGTGSRDPDVSSYHYFSFAEIQELLRSQGVTSPNGFGIELTRGGAVLRVRITRRP